MKCLVVFKSGEKVEFESDAIRVKESSLTGEVTEISWAESSSAPIYLRFSEIAAIFRMAE